MAKGASTHLDPPKLAADQLAKMAYKAQVRSKMDGAIVATSKQLSQHPYS
jgi:hypothetical protein